MAWIIKKEQLKYIKKWKMEHPEKGKEYNRRYRKKHPEKIKVYNKKWNRINRKEYYIKYKEKLKKWVKVWQTKNREKVNSYQRNYYKNRTQNQKNLKILRDNNRMACKKKAKGSFTLEEWQNKKKEFNYECVKCKISEEELLNKNGLGLTIDHIIPISKKGTNWILNIQPLCKSCNSSKGNRIA